MTKHMEFSRNFIELNKAQHYTLSIRVTTDGFCFCVLDNSQQKFIFFKNVVFEPGIDFTDIAPLQQLIDVEPLFNYPLQNIVVIYGGQYYTLLPDELFDAAQKDNYYKFNQPLQASEIVRYDKIETCNIVNIYSIPEKLVELLSAKFPQASMLHSSTLLIKDALSKSKNNKKEQVYVDVSNNHFFINIVKNEKLLLSNSYSFSSREELMYYIVNTYDKLQLDRQTITLFLSGQVGRKAKELNILKDYIKHIEFTKYNGQNTLISQFKEIDTHKYINLLTACES